MRVSWRVRRGRTVSRRRVSFGLWGGTCGELRLLRRKLVVTHCGRRRRGGSRQRVLPTVGPAAVATEPPAAAEPAAAESAAAAAAAVAIAAAAVTIAAADVLECGLYTDDAKAWKVRRP